jgi:hypothetical protein
MSRELGDSIGSDLITSLLSNRIDSRADSHHHRMTRMRAREAALKILESPGHRFRTSVPTDADLLFPIEIASVINTARHRFDFGSVDFTEDFIPRYGDEGLRWLNELVTVASDPNLPLALRKATLTGFEDPGDDGWESQELSAAIAMINDDSIPPFERLKIANSYTAYSDPIGVARNALLISVVNDSRLDVETRVAVANSIRVAEEWRAEFNTKDEAVAARADLFNRIVSRGLLEALSVLNRISVAAAVESTSGVLELARIADEFDEYRPLAANKLSALAVGKGVPPEVQLLAHKLWHGMIRTVIPTEGPHVFISYVSDDVSSVEKLERDLRALGVNGWLDKKRLKPGQRWRDELRRAIREGAAFIAVFSNASESRERSYMREELNLAIDELRLRPRDRTWFIPVLLSNVKLPELSIGPNEYLSDIQYTSLVSGWDERVAELAEVIAQINAP